MGIIDRKRVGPLLLMVSLAVVGSMIMLLMATTTFEETVSAQGVDCDGILGSLLPECQDDGDDDPMPASTPDDGGNGGSSGCVGDDTPVSSLPGATLCSSLTATAQALTATAEANASATAEALTATAEALTATAEALTATAEANAAAALTATAVAQAAATAQVNADATATARARDVRRTAVAAAQETATAEAQAIIAAGGAPPPAPKASPTPVMTEMAEVTAAEGATTIEPDMSAELMAGNVTVKFPTLSRARTYQAMVSESSDCGGMAEACAMVSIYNAEGEMESDVRLISAAEIVVTLDADTVSAMGDGLNGAAVAIQANALGGVMLQLMDDESGEWNSIPSEFMVNDDGSVTVSAMTRRLGHVALNVHSDVVADARMQLSMALGTPTATPVPPTATPAPPTATPVPPTPTPIPPPDTGDTSMPFLMLLAMAIVASMAALVGAKVITARVRR